MKIKELNINLKDWEFEFQQRNEHPILMADLWCRSLNGQFEEESNLPMGKLDYMFTSSSKGYIKKKQKKYIIESLKKAIEKEDYLSYIYKKTQKRIAELDKTADKIIKNLEKKDLAVLWKEFDYIFLKVIPWFYIPWYIIEYNMLSDKVREGFNNINDNELLSLIFPDKKTHFQEEQEEFYKLVKFAKSKKNFEKNKVFLNKANYYLKKYSWMKTFILLPIEPLPLSELIQRVKEAIKNKFSEQYELQKKQKIENTRLAKDILKRAKNKDIIKTVNWAREFAWLLNWSVEESLFATARLQIFFKKIAKKLGIPYTQWVLLTSKEISRGLQGKSIISKTELKNRQKGYIYIIGNGKTMFLFGKKAKKVSDLVDSNISIVDVSIKEFKGQPASPGIVKGKVRISMLAKDAHKIQDGEVLICSMTSPDYVPAMKRASAIVTDEGGLLSHASIVSRELGKPCIVGTKIATKVLKDGDLVEVDANKGAVRKLK